MLTDFAVEGFLYLFASLIQVGIYVAMVIHSLKNSTISQKNKHFWTIPVILQIVSIFFSVFALTHRNIRSVNLISEILLCVGFVFLGMYMNENNKIIDMGKDTTASSLAGYCDLTKHILLLIFTFGIWHYIWIYRTTDFLNTTPNEEKQNPTNKLLLCMFVPFYYIYWIYKNAKRIDNLALSKGKESDICTVCLILAIFIPIIPPILMQDKMNKAVKFSGNNNFSYGAPSKPHIDTLGTADEIKKYKELLDMGIITEEEFNAKKKQLLGL